MTPVLSDKGTLLVPVPTASLELRSCVTLGDTVFVPKTEHHITIFGYRTGRLLLAAAKGEPDLLHRIEFLANNVAWDWKGWQRSGFFFTLERDEPKPLSTIIELVRAPVVKFYEHVAKEVDGVKWPELSAVLRSPPPAHITLYTTDKTGVGGIGLDRDADFKLALTTGGDRKLRAYALAMDLSH